MIIDKLYELGFLVFLEDLLSNIYSGTSLCIYENTFGKFKILATYLFSHFHR